jgi:hypothetical protein
MIRMKHPDTGAVIDVHDSSESILAASGWQKLTKTESAQLDRQHAAEIVEQEAAMRPAKNPAAETTIGPDSTKEST